MKNLLVCLVPCFIFACAKEQTSQVGASASPQKDIAVVVPSENFDCNDTRCESGSEYCLLSVKNETYLTTACVRKSDTITDCDSAERDALNQFPTSDHCRGMIGCYSTRGKITVTCYVPQPRR